MNFADVKPVIQASKDLLGEDGIYYMIAYKPLQESSAFRLWCKAHDMHVSEYDKVAKNLESYENDSKWKDLIEGSKVFRGVVESVAPSPCSFLLSNDKISEMVGLIKVGDQTCCCLDGYNCDVYKFLKNDYLTVSVYRIINDTYQLIGRPIDDIKTLVDNSDDAVWDIYSRGLTTTINQADSDFDKQILTKYKPRNLAELSAYVAAIRPGFASLLNNFVERRPYTTGVQELDNILSDSFNYLMYQESIMKYLVWLGMEEKGTYDIIKKIAKKKFKETELEELKATLLDGWVKNVGKVDGFAETWQVVEDASRYSFNASHSLSVAIDSLYGAYLKAHYPLEYYTVALTLYSGDEDRTLKMIDELPHFGIRLGDILFRKSGADYTMDKTTRTIYRGMESIKYMNRQVAEELYELRNEQYVNFFDLLDAIEHTSCDSRQLDILIRIGYFAEFGHMNALLRAVEIYNAFANMRSIRVESAIKKGYDIDLISKYARKVTAKTLSQIDNRALMMDIMKTDKRLGRIVSTSPVHIIRNQLRHLGYTSYHDGKRDANDWIVVDIKTNKYGSTFCKLYNICYGAMREYRANRKYIQGNPLHVDQCIKVVLVEKDRMKRGEDGNWIPTGEKLTEMKCWKVVDA